MCGRYALFGPSSRLREQFGTQTEFEWADTYNVAPSQRVPVIRAAECGRREIVLAQWGLLASWVAAVGQARRPVNAKLETAAGKPMFRAAFRHSRVLVPACGFYEWRPGPDSKQPYFIRSAGGESLLGFGGLLECRDGSDGPVRSFAILTTAANESIAPIHERMPVIIAPENYADWLDPEVTDVALLVEIAQHCDPERIEAFPVDGAVGNVRAQGPQLVAPLAPATGGPWAADVSAQTDRPRRSLGDAKR
ncbi:SOS response-associated peptidase [Aromatoleum sp.]|uniref:SOS response-associated peptidase n=1 Tax=Aromatoleum sp. TaxID=2307007 RepID=UPI002FCC0796